MKRLQFKVLVFGFLFSTVLFSCGDSGSTAVKDITVNENVVADTESELAIEGMVCSMGCVAAIQDELKSTNGVAFAAVDYENSKAIIKYDSKLVSEDELIAAIQNIGDHQYSASKVVNSVDTENDEFIETIEVLEEVSSALGR